MTGPRQTPQPARHRFGLTRMFDGKVAGNNAIMLTSMIDFSGRNGKPNIVHTRENAPRTDLLRDGNRVPGPTRGYRKTSPDR